MFDLKEEIATARRELRLAQGQPMAEEEQESKRREKAMDELDGFLFAQGGREVRCFP